MARLTREDWIAEGFKILSEFAQDKLKILYLCQRLKVTRGSFYHHFKSIEDYINALMEAWQEENTLQLIRNSKEGQTAYEKMDIINAQVAASNFKLEASIRSWSYYHPIVKQYVDKADTTRLAFLQDIFMLLGFEKELAYKKGMLDYAVLIGIQQLKPNLKPEELQELFKLYYPRPDEVE